MKRKSTCAALLLPVLAASPGAARAADAKPVLAVCADPRNLPYSNDREEGFENRIATLLAADLHADLHYTWNLERRSFFRRTLLVGKCDVVISVPQHLPILATTRPFFTSGYVFVTRSHDKLQITSFDDPALKEARIGLQLLGLEGANPPPAMSLAMRGITGHITGFPMWAGEDIANPQGRIIDAVASGKIDVAIVWGPFAGYYAKPYGDTLQLNAIDHDPKLPDQPYSFAMSMGVRKADLPMRDRLQAAIGRHQPEIDAILKGYGIPLMPPLATQHADTAPTP